MSRTDRHRPYRVQVADPLERNWYWFYQGSRFGWQKLFFVRLCGCWLCNDREGRIAANRLRRHEDRRRAREARKGDLDAFDRR